MVNLKTHFPFALVLAGGGARGLAHAGVLRAMEHYGFRPSAVVGVSMGAVVAVTYALNPDWYEALVNMDTEGFPTPPTASSSDFRERVRALLASERMLQDMILGWGVGARSLEWGRALLEHLTLGRRLEQGRIRVATVATDLYHGKRVVLRRGSAAEAAYASAALAGLLPPLRHDEGLLADGCYADLVPIDVARGPDDDLVIAVDVQQQVDLRPPSNGIQAILRAVDICSQEHARLRFREADLVIRPQFPLPIDTLEFSRKRICIAAGSRAVRASIEDLRQLLRNAEAPSHPGQADDTNRSD